MTTLFKRIWPFSYFYNLGVEHGVCKATNWDKIMNEHIEAHRRLNDQFL